jgi:hypothetical protein
MTHNGRKLYDPGKGGVGGYVGRRGAMFGICPSCGGRRVLSRLAWSRASRPQCSCGAYLEPSKQSQAEYGLTVVDKHAVVPHESCVICHGTLSRYNQQQVCGSVRCRRAYDAIREHFVSKSDGFTDIEWTESLEEVPQGFRFRGRIRFWTRTIRQFDVVVNAAPIPQATIRPKDSPTCRSPRAAAELAWLQQVVAEGRKSQQTS